MKPTEETKSTDGGSTTTPFDTVSETTLTRSERVQIFVDTTILSPLKIAWSDRRARFGVIIVALYVVMGTIGVWLVNSPSPHRYERLEGPFVSLAYPLGTDHLGRSVWAQIVHGTPPMLEMIIAGAVFTTGVAVVVGILSGYKGGTVDRVLMTVTDIFMTIPGLPLVIVLAVILSPRSPWVVGVILSVNAWASLARALRSQVLTLREESYVEASRVMGVPTWYILQNDISPNLMPYILVNFVYSARNVIFASVGLYFLGILPFSHENWGVMMNLAYTSAGSLYTLGTFHYLFFPMLAIILLVFALIMFAQGADRLFNPRIRARHAGSVSDNDSVEEGSEEISSSEIEY